MGLYLGIDFGTSGARSAVIDENGSISHFGRFPFDIRASGSCLHWRLALFELLEQIPGELRRDIRAIAINGTSSTVLLCDATGEPVGVPLLYNDASGQEMLTFLRDVAPAKHTVLSATSSLVKLLWMMQLPDANKARYFLHQADWLGFLLHGQLGISDYHNALKLGYDVEAFKYPQWMDKLRLSIELPKVITPGSPVGELRSDILARYDFPSDCLVCGGTTDSIAAFIASGAKSPGEAVTSLGSTLALKLLSRTRVEDARYGIYSHRLGDLWLTGGASNTGGAVLKAFFSDEELERLSGGIDGSRVSELDYYPLLQVGERFPINDASLLPRMEPRPGSSVEFLHGLLEGMARIEARGYELLQELGADSLVRVFTAGGGARNDAWTMIRRRCLEVDVMGSVNTEAAFGSALLAMLNKET
jgi:D-ribulokinase